MASYEQIIGAIRAVCINNNTIYQNDDGTLRLRSINKTEYLRNLQFSLEEYATFHNIRAFTIDLKKPNVNYYDININGIPITFKLHPSIGYDLVTKSRILYTVTGKVVSSKDPTYNEFYRRIQAADMRDERDVTKEPHYLVIHQDGSIFIKSIIDLRFFYVQSGELKVDWDMEFRSLYDNYTHPSFKEKIREILGKLQQSVRETIATMDEFAEAEI
jgi:hypothetical protein